MQEALKQIKDKESFINFKYLFESIIGFYQKDRNAIAQTNYNRNNKNNNRGRR